MGLSLLLGLVQVGIVGVEIKSVVRRGSWRGKFKANRGKRTEWRWRVVDVDEDGDVGLERREEVGRYSDRALPDTPED